MTYDKSRFLLLLKKASGESKDKVRKRIHENEIAGLKSDISGRSYSLKSNEANFLQRYKQKLVNHENNAQKIKLIEENYSEIENIFDTLKNEVDHAFEESVELEHISQALKDKELVRKTKYDESAVEDLREKLEHMISMKKEMEKRESKLESLTQHFDNIEHAVRLRIELIETVIDESSGGGPTLTEPWQLVAKDPSKEPDWDTRDDDLWKDGWKWLPRDADGNPYYWMTNHGSRADQGWKIHVAVNPDDKKEVFEVTKAILPVLNKIDSSRKFARSAEGSKGGLKNKGGETAVKIATIYPKKDSGKSNVNRNKKNTESIVAGLVSALSDKGVLDRTKGVETIGEFNVKVSGNPTRIFLRYERIGGGKVIDDSGNKYNGYGRSKGRKPGLVPEGFETKYGVNLDGNDIRELPGLKFPSFQMELPGTNFDT